MEKTLHHPDYPPFLDLLRQARRDAGVTQVQVAASLDVPQSTVAKWETGHQRIDILEFCSYCEAVGADPIEILTAYRKHLA